MPAASEPRPESLRRAVPTGPRAAPFRMNLWNKFRDGLQRTRDAIVGGVGAALGRAGPVDAADARARSKRRCSRADVGPDTTDRLIERARKLHGARTARSTCAARSSAPRRTCCGRPASPCAFAPGPGQRPWVALIVGVNGAGKTTFAGKLAARFAREGHPALLVAADTFRAAASEQLVVWAERAGVEIVRAPRRRRPGRRWCTTGSPRRRRAAPTSCWWTPRAGCTPSRT